MENVIMILSAEEVLPQDVFFFKKKESNSLISMQGAASDKEDPFEILKRIQITNDVQIILLKLCDEAFSPRAEG